MSVSITDIFSGKDFLIMAGVFLVLAGCITFLINSGIDSFEEVQLDKATTEACSNLSTRPSELKECEQFVMGFAKEHGDRSDVINYVSLCGESEGMDEFVACMEK